MLQISTKFETIIKEHPLYSSDKKIVLYRGEENSPDFLFVGEAPGKDENRVGKPFVGKSGEVLNDWIVNAGVTSFGVTNVCPLIPLDGGKVRRPTDEEIDYFKFLVDWIIETVNPRHIITLGDSASIGIYGKKNRDTFLRLQRFGKITGTSIYHPMYYAYRDELENGEADFLKAVSVLRLQETVEVPQAPKEELAKILDEQYDFDDEEDEPKLKEDIQEVEAATKRQRYFPLHVHTEYSIGDGANRTKELARVLFEKGFLGAGVSDHGHLNGTYYFQKDLSERKLKSLLGIEMYLYDADEFPKKEKKEKRGDEDKSVGEEEEEVKIHRHHITIYAKNEEGWKNLLELMWIACTEGFYYKPRILLKHLLKHKRGLLALSGCMDGFLMHHVLKSEPGKAIEYAQLFQREFGDDYFVEIMPHFEIPGFKEASRQVYKIAKNLGIKTTVSLDCHYAIPEKKKIHDAVLAINKRKKFGESSYKGNSYYLMDDEDLLERMMKGMGFKKAEVEEMFKVSLEIADRCNFAIQRFNSADTMPYFKESAKTFMQIVSEEFEKRPFKDDIRYVNRLMMETERILKRGYDAYFLMVRDIIQTAKELGVMYGPGRGSVGGSLVAYLLGFHKADPIENGLLFDRFISEDRKDLPDIDMDFQDSGREKLVDRLIEKYGGDKVCGIIAFSKLHGKGAIRDIGRICGVDRGEIERVAGVIVTKKEGEEGHEMTLADSFDGFEVGQKFKEKYPDAAEIAIGIEGRIRTFTRHAAGLIITREPIRRYVPVYRVNGEIVSGWEKRAVEEIGLVKLDVLGLKSLDIVSRCLELSGVSLPDKWDDPKVYENVFLGGNTSGVFQFESPGLTKYVADLKCRDFKTLVDASALYRPGTLRSGMAADYQKRKVGQEETVYEHPMMEEITKDTFGVLVYQEQIMILFNKIGGFDWGTCEKLRKVISKSMGEAAIHSFKAAFMNHATEVLRMNRDTAEAIFDKTVKFGSYGFNKAHSCTYSILSYMMAWIKTYHPEIFFSVLLDREDDPEQARVYVQNAREMGVNVVPPHIERSQAGYSVDVASKTIFCGLKSIKGVGDAAVADILAGRPYKTLQDVFKAVNKGVIKVLVQAGAMDDLISSRKFILENLDTLRSKNAEIPQKATEYSEKELALLQNKVLDFYSERHISTYFRDPFGSKVKYQSIADMEFKDYQGEVWIKGAVASITFKQDNMGEKEPLFGEGLLERKYAYMDVYDESGGHLHVHLYPEMCTYYKNLLEKKKFPVVIKGHTVPDTQKLYMDAMVDLEDPDRSNPIFDYMDSTANKKAEAILRRVEQARQRGVYVGVVVSASYRVKDGEAFVKFVFRDGSRLYTRDLQKGIVYVPGQVVKAKKFSRDAIGEIEIF